MEGNFEIMWKVVIDEIFVDFFGGP